MQIDKIKDIKQLKAMIQATRSHLARIADDINPDVLDEMRLDLMRLKLRLEELSPNSLQDEEGE